LRKHVIMGPDQTIDVSTVRYKLSQIFMLLGLGIFVVSAGFATRGREPFATWFFDFAWWSYLLFIDGWVYRHRGESLLLNHPGRFLFLACWSVLLWFLFEAFNLRLQNWAYVGLPAALPLRWFGYAIAFATVAPAILETADLVETAQFIKEGRVRPLGWRRSVGPYFMALGALMLLLPLLWPRFFFPLVWGGFLFLLEPLNARWGVPSLITDWREGRLHRFWILLISGFFCGVLWEWWNSWSGARWVYSVPWVSGCKIFEMPLLGYLGFPPFAVSVFVMTVFAVTLWEKSPRPVRALLVLAAAAAVLLMCAAVDQFTVKGFQP